MYLRMSSVTYMYSVSNCLLLSLKTLTMVVTFPHFSQVPISQPVSVPLVSHLFQRDHLKCDRPLFLHFHLSQTVISPSFLEYWFPISQTVIFPCSQTVSCPFPSVLHVYVYWQFPTNCYFPKPSRLLLSISMSPTLAHIRHGTQLTGAGLGRSVSQWSWWQQFQSTGGPPGSQLDGSPPGGVDDQARWDLRAMPPAAQTMVHAAVGQFQFLLTQSPGNSGVDWQFPADWQFFKSPRLLSFPFPSFYSCTSTCRLLCFILRFSISGIVNISHLQFGGGQF